MPAARRVPLALVLALIPTVAVAAPTSEAESGLEVRHPRSGRTPTVPSDALDLPVERAQAEHRAEQEAREQSVRQPAPILHQSPQPGLIEHQIHVLTRLLKISEEDLEMADVMFRLAGLHLAYKTELVLAAESLSESIREAERAEAEH